MKKYIFILISIITVFAQSSNAQEITKETEKSERERQKLAEKQERKRLNSPAQIEINASSSDISKLLVNVFKGKSYKVDQMSRRKIGMSLIPRQINTQTATGGVADRKLIISLDEKNGLTKVTINIGLLAPDAFGRIGYVSLDSDKKSRAEIEEILSAVKAKIESVNNSNINN